MPKGQFPKIAVQIPAWNQAEELADCLNFFIFRTILSKNDRYFPLPDIYGRL
jgi:hypothetical protein